MPGPSDEDLALAYWFLKSKQDKMSNQKKKVKKLDKRMKKLTKFKKWQTTSVLGNLAKKWKWNRIKDRLD